MTALQQARLPHVPPAYRLIFQRCYANEALRPERIKAKCLDCCGYERTVVASCTATACPLWPIRPYQASGDKIPPTSGRTAKDGGGEGTI